MFKGLNFTDAEKKEILKSMVMLWDSNEQKNQHILDYFISKNISYQKHNFDFADYSFLVPKNEKLGIFRDLYFNKFFSIERKAHLEELSKNLGDGRTQFENEFLRSGNCKIVLLIEKGSILDIIESKYNTDFKAVSYLASLISFQQRYDLNVNFIEEKYSGLYIYKLCYYFLRNLLK